MSVDDQELERLARRLGSRVAADLDVEETALAVLSRLKSEPERLVWWRRKPWLSVVAAAAVLFVAIGILADNRGNNPNETTGELAPMPLALLALADNELEEVFDSLLFEAPVSELAVAGLEDMSVGQLEELLQTMMED